MSISLVYRKASHIHSIYFNKLDEHRKHTKDVFSPCLDRAEESGINLMPWLAFPAQVPATRC